MWLSILLPAALGFLYVRAFGVSVVFSDAWSMVHLFDAWSSGTLRLSDLYAPHNEHRMFFPKGVEVLLGAVTEYDNVVEMYVIEVCFLITLAVLLLAFRAGTRPWLVLFIPVSILIFSFRQYENMLFGFQINFAFTQTFGVLALFLLDVFARRGSRKLPLAAALGSATVASFSTAQGLFVWPAGLLQLLIGPAEKPAKRVSVVVWGLAGLGEWVAYFADYARPEGSASLLSVLDRPLTGATYFLTLLGSSLFWQQTFALLGGLFIACLALVSLGILARDKKLAQHSFWVSLLLYSLLMLAAITVGRAGLFGPLQALASRYTTFSILAVASVYAVLAKMAFESRSSIRAALLVPLCGAVLFSAAVSYPDGVGFGSATKVARERAAFVLSTYESQPDRALMVSLDARAEVVR